jgi:ubiquinone biosynthesis protein UbiJ
MAAKPDAQTVAQMAVTIASGLAERLTDVQLSWWLSHATDDWQIAIGRELVERRHAEVRKGRPDAR